MKHLIPAVICSLLVGLGTGLVLSAFLLENVNRNSAMAGVLLSEDNAISSEERARRICLAVAADQDFVPALVGLAKLLRDPGDSIDASKQLVSRASTLVLSGAESPYKSMTSTERQAEVQRIIADVNGQPGVE